MEGNDHITDCYFCTMNLKVINLKNTMSNTQMFLLKIDRWLMAQTFIFLSQVVTWNIALIPKIMTRLLQLEMTHTSQKRTTSKYNWYKQNLTTWHETKIFQRNLHSSWVHVSKITICWHQEQCSSCIETGRDN